MDQSISKKENTPDDPISSLQGEIAALEAELGRVKKELGAFESVIHSKLDRQIGRLRELSELYKKQKKEKKTKRLEQKKRGKSYKEPKQLKISEKQQDSPIPLNTDEQKELKRLFKEAVVHVHPDKFAHSGEEDKIKRATAITAQLNGIYKRGDLEELIQFYQLITNENTIFANSSNNGPGQIVIDAKTRLASLKRKKETVAMELERIKSSYTYNVLISYENPLSFIDELQIYFEERIKVFEKRTRKG